jgi:hypothetical protein
MMTKCIYLSVSFCIFFSFLFFLFSFFFDFNSPLRVWSVKNYGESLDPIGEEYFGSFNTNLTYLILQVLQVFTSS